MLKLKLQYFGHLMQRAESLKKTLMPGKIEGRRRRGWQKWDAWMASPMLWTWVWTSSRSWWWTGRPGVLQSLGSQRVGHDWATELNWAPVSVQELKQSFPLVQHTLFPRSDPDTLCLEKDPRLPDWVTLPLDAWWLSSVVPHISNCEGKLISCHLTWDTHRLTRGPQGGAPTFSGSTTLPTHTVCTALGCLAGSLSPDTVDWNRNSS